MTISVPPAESDLPVRLRVTDDLARTRVTVFFRLLLAIPHLIWFALWTVAAIVAAIVNWVVIVITGRPIVEIHYFVASYVRYSVHVFAYLSFAADPYPRFLGAEGYPVDVEIDGPVEQERWKAFFRLVLGIPALIVSSALSGGRGYGTGGNMGALGTVAFLGWFAALARGSTPRGFRNLAAYALQYSAQVGAYVLLLTERYPNSDPSIVEIADEATSHPITLAVEDDRRRTPLTVFFRIFLAIPHVLLLLLWGIAAFFVGIANWVATLFQGRSPQVLHDFLRAYVRYETRVTAYLFLVADPFPAFGSSGSYPVDLSVAEPVEQDRWQVGFRVFLAVPALILAGALGSALFAAGVLGWFTGLFRSEMPVGLRNLAAYALRYAAQTNAYFYLLTPHYPDSAILRRPG